LNELSSGKVDNPKLYSQVRVQFNVNAIQLTEDALNSLCGHFSPETPFPLDWLWMAPTSRFGGEMNTRIQE
jgi:hypothetical protein